MNGLRTARAARLSLLGMVAAAVGISSASADPIQPGYAAIVVDAGNREVLYANGADLPRHPASITKIMTLFLAFDALSSGQLHLGDRLVMSRHAVAQKPSHLGLGVGQSISVDDAIKVIAVKSANDLAVALAERLGGTEENFAAMMTRKARSLGMLNTTFVNATGLPDPAHITTARDIAILSVALIRTYPNYYRYFSTEKFAYERQVFANHNHLLGRMPGMDGIKTGYTADAGFTLAASAVRNGHRLVTVVLGEPSIAARDRDVTALMDTGFTVEAGRSQGQAISVASLLAPLSHPAIRLGLPSLEEGSTDGPAKPPAPRIARADPPERRHSEPTADARHARRAEHAPKHELARASHAGRGADGGKRDHHEAKEADRRPAHHADRQARADADKATSHKKATKVAARTGRKHGATAEADARPTHKHRHDG